MLLTFGYNNSFECKDEVSNVRALLVKLVYVIICVY